MRKFTKLFCTAFLLLAGGVSASAQEDDRVYATFENCASTDVVTWDLDSKTFSWNLGYSNQLHGINLPNGNITGYEKVVLKCKVLEGSGYRIMFYATNKGTTAGGTTVVEQTAEDGEVEVSYNFADFTMDADYLQQNSEFCVSGYGDSGKVQIISIYFVKSADPLAGAKKLLTDAITAAESRNSYAKTEASWKALTEALAAGKTALEAADATQESLEAAATAIYDAIDGLKLTKGYSNLSTDLFHVWTGPGADATITDDAVYPANEVGKSIGQGVTVWGDPSVRYVQYADLSEYKQLVILGTPGFTARLCLNRQEPVEGGDANGSAYIEIIEDLNEDGVLVIDLENHDKLKDATYIHLNSFKTPYNGKTGTFSEVLLRESVVTPVELTLAEGDIAAALAAEKAKIEPLDIVGDITINLTKGANYTVSAPIVAAGNVTVTTEAADAARGAQAAELAIIDASGLTAPMFTTPSEDGTWAESTFSLSNVSIKGLAQPLFASAAKSYLFTDFTVDNSIVEVVGDVTVFDFTKGSVAVNFNVTNSTFYAPTETTKAMYSSQSGQKATEAGEYTQTFKFTKNTIYNFAKEKNFFSHRQNNQKWLAYDVQNNIFVNCGKSGQTIKGMNGGTPGTNPIWTIIGNAFNFDGADTSAAEATGDDEEPVQNSVVGVVTFTDAANGDFNGTFELAEGAQAPEALGDGRWTINFGGEVAQGIIYVWDAGTETGGEAVASDGESVGLANAGFTTIRLNGAKDYSTNVVTITLAQELKTGDKINFTAYRNKNAANKQSGVKAKFDKGGEISTTTGLEFVNIDQSDDSAEDSNRGTEPNTISFDIPAEAAGSTVITMTRAATQTNLFITKIEIGDGTTVGINTIQQATVNSNAIYNMNGQRVMNAQKGLYIVNGKKVIVK